MRIRGGRQLLCATSALVLGAGAAVPVHGQAQYFGRQKVQYEDFDWRVLGTEHFNVHYYPAAQVAAEDGARMGERWYTRFSRIFQHEFGKKPIIFYADHPDFQQTNTTPYQLTEGTGGFTDALRNRIVMPFTGVYADNDHVVGHEMVHVFQYDLATSPGGGGLVGMNNLPGWLIEGMAEYLSLGREDAHTAMWLRDAALRGQLPTIRQLTRDTRYFPYRYGQALWAYIAGRFGDRAVPELYRYATRAGWEEALQRVLGVTSEQVSQDWVQATRALYLPLIEGKQRPQDAGDPILVEDEPGAMHLSPTVSPDGQHVAFFGRREIFTVDLYLADARTGRVIRKLTSPSRSAHFDALSFISSAGTWSPDGSRFAFVAFEQGDHRLQIMNVSNARVERRISVPGVGAIQNPAWSPDGRSIAFSGMAGGVTDLYLVDVETGALQQLTNDRYAELHPAWSPDGRSIAFATDRDQGTDFGNLVYGDMRLALYDVASAATRLLDVFPSGKHINPQFAADGSSLYFVADPDGFSNIYRLELASGSVFRVTDAATGVSGITKLSPALSIAARSGRMLFSVFQNSGHNVYGLDPERTQGREVERTAPRVAAAALLPPAEAFGSGVIHEYLGDVLTGLPPVDATFSDRDYKPSIGLDYIGPPSFGIGVSQFGTGVGGGVSLFFSDMLGDHFIGTAVQANGSFKDIGGQAVYMNSSRRWNYGVALGHIPYLSGYGFNQPETFTQVLQRTYIDQVMGITQYPFSMTRRFELSAGATRYAFSNEAMTFSRFTGELVDRRDLPAHDPLYFAEGSAAFVGDNSYFGFTSPVAGTRFRFEVSPTFGSLTYQALLADYRRYVFFRPFTFAVRGFHYGRYGADAAGFSDGERIMSPLFVGYENFVRGYSQESFEWERECGPTETANSACPAFDRLVGTRMAVGNVELRVPLLGVSELGLLNFPFLPTEIAPFFDIGYAWGDVYPEDVPGAEIEYSRRAVYSAGVSARVNLLGYLILETYWAHPFQRPEKGGHFGFQIMPGW
ncbi:MAG TPA: basic secretory protein-like protein [Longimicrobiales bacterium]|nr:basic secretory protein-like protein [Longimicrobiales bacterium]